MYKRQVERAGGVGRVGQQSGDVRRTGGVLVGDGGGQQRGDAGAQRAAEALADDQAEVLVQRPVGSAVGAGQGEGAEGRFAQHGRVREPVGQVGQYRGEQSGEGDRAGQLVGGVLAQAVGDPHIEAELEERARAVQGPDRGGGRERGAAGAEVDHVAAVQRSAQQRVFAHEFVLPGVGGQQPVAVRDGGEAVEQGGRGRVGGGLGDQFLPDGEVAQREFGAGLGGVVAPVAAFGGAGLGCGVEPVSEEQGLLGLQVAVGSGAGAAGQGGRDRRAAGGELAEELLVDGAGAQFQFALDLAGEFVPVQLAPAAVVFFLHRSGEAVCADQ